ncbi:hypothetical protein [Paenibacillus alginolyticus]|uniref:hypothetical protein n=1 Tax=Paenibacillus alginolyticus TaxID=59839 RepID=UPI002DBB16DB|nr:hypothetical protein [Paenibacillus alginolyticus]MEC0144362.1 hypothetical protein [Paenibacillus alginolyticus]
MVKRNVVPVTKDRVILYKNEDSWAGIICCSAVFSISGKIRMFQNVGVYNLTKVILMNNPAQVLVKIA